MNVTVCLNELLVFVSMLSRYKHNTINTSWLIEFFNNVTLVSNRFIDKCHTVQWLIIEDCSGLLSQGSIDFVLEQEEIKYYGSSKWKI